MIINKYMVIYYLFLACSFILGLLSAVIGLKTIWKWRFIKTPEEQYNLEKNFYLCSSAMFVGISIRIMMIPLWYFMLQSLIPLIPGAMCLAGVHACVPFYSWAASSLKIILPLLYFTWIMITILDNKMKKHPFLNFRHYFLIPVILFVFLETFVDMKYLFSLAPRTVTCCTAMFDLGSSSTTAQIFTETHWGWVLGFCVIFVLQNILMMLSKKNNRIIDSSLIIGSILLSIALLFSLHTKLSPVILEAPFHHCIFCLVQINMFVLIGTAVLMLGVYFNFVYGLLRIIQGKTGVSEKTDIIKLFYQKIRLAIWILYGLGVLLILFPFIKHL